MAAAFTQSIQAIALHDMPERPHLYSCSASTAETLLAAFQVVAQQRPSAPAITVTPEEGQP